MRAPELTKDDVYTLLGINKDVVTELEYKDRGGQKTVFTCKINGVKFALKFCDVTDAESKENQREQQESESDQADNVALSRAKREIDIMHRVDSPTLVKLGPIGLNLADLENKKILYFSEEYIDGSDLYYLISQGAISYLQTVELAIDITTAIKQLWNIKMVHRDIKPKNIMRRIDGSYVLLDTGIAFDIHGETLTAAFHLVGSQIYMSPEQLSGYRRELDFRSDLFLLGIVLYEVSTGQHPFFQSGLNTYQIFANITTNNLVPPSKLVSDFPKKLERIITRLLAKEPHLRYKTCDQLLKQLYSQREEL
ncbi:serine/threonine protein kinase [Virgibacillus halodenitrificans]|uniref:serine/threonine protein kinase n=1 Tax=Virgibacillus halodenitrificans TaxID=1482 RepID=UPI00076121C6